MFSAVESVVEVEVAAIVVAVSVAKSVADPSLVLNTAVVLELELLAYALGVGG